MKISQVQSYTDIHNVKWFKAMDILKQLELSQTNVTKFLTQYVPEKYKNRDLNGFTPGMPSWYISAEGIYRLMLNSKTDYCNKFKSWVTDVILPSVLTNNYYVNFEKINESQVQSLIEKLTNHRLDTIQKVG